jgi:hypothetical protein
MGTGITISVIGIFSLVWCLVVNGSHCDDEHLRDIVLKDAHKSFPSMSIPDALHSLYCHTIREIQQAHKQNNFDTLDLEDRLTAIQMEYQRHLMIEA